MQEDSVTYKKVIAEDDLMQPVSHFSYELQEQGSIDSLQQMSYMLGGEKNAVGHEGTPLPFNLEKVDGIFVLLIACFLIFGHIYNGGLTFVKENISLLFSSEKTLRGDKQITTREILYSYFLLFQGIVLIAIGIYDAIIETGDVVREIRPLNSMVTILLFIIVIGLFLGFKDFVYRFIGYIFDLQQAMARWRRLSVISIEILGILYFIPVLFLVYFHQYHLQILVFMLILFLIVQITLFHQIIVFFINQKFNFLYLIAYLCTFEILPYIFLSTGLIYLYRIDYFNTLWL